MRQRIAFAFVGVLLLVSPLFVSADAISDLQAQIQALLARLAALQAQQTTTPLPPTDLSDDYPTPTPYNSCPNLTRTLQRGARDVTTGGEVSELQIFLADHFNLNENDIVSGYFGPTTHRYVVKFQEEQGLPAFGIVGSLTRAAIARVCAGSVPTPLPSVPPFLPPTPIAQCPAIGWIEPISPCFNGSWKPTYSDLGCQNGWQCVPNAPFGSVRIYLKAPANNSSTVVGSPILITWHVEGVTRRNTQVLLQLKPLQVSGGVGGGTWQSAELPLGQSTQTYSWQTGGSYLSSLGTYQLTAYVVACEPQGCTYNYDQQGGLGRERLATSESIQISVQQSTSGGITVTTPNGGERWEIGQLNTITWAPYVPDANINNSRDVMVNLLKRMTTCTTGDKCDWFSTIGRVMDTGKASLHTYFNIDNYTKWADPGEYYVQVVNNVTGAIDTSDAPFMLLPRAVDVKVNGSDGPISLYDNQPISVTLTTSGVTSCTVSGVRERPGGNYSGMSFTPNTTRTLYAFAPAGGGNTAVSATCYRLDGNVRGDAVSVVIVGTPVIPSQLRVATPNGGEQISLDQSYTMVYDFASLKSVSLALYKNDQWYAWLAKDIPLSGTNSGRATKEFVPSTTVPGLTTGEAIYKIYATGQKADGTGYVDDKSDGPFSFLQSVAPAPTCIVGTNKPQYTIGEQIIVSWNSTNATYVAFDSPAPGFSIDGGKNAVNGSTIAQTNIAGNYTITARAFNAIGQQGSCSVPLSVVGVPAGSINASGAPIGGGTSSNISGNTTGVKLADLTFTASGENVRMTMWKFTIRNVNTSAEGGPKNAVPLTVTVANIGGKEYPVQLLSSGLYSNYQVSLGAGQDFAKDIPTQVQIYGNTGASSGGGSVDLWFYPNDLTFRGVTSGTNIIPTSSVTNRGEHIYWSGYMFVSTPTYSQSNYYSQGAYQPEYNQAGYYAQGSYNTEGSAVPLQQNSNQLAAALTALQSLLQQMLELLK